MFTAREWGALITTGIVGGIVSTLLVAVLRLGASVDNLLNFLGGAVGAGLAVVGALWIEDRKKESLNTIVYDNLMIMCSSSSAFITDNGQQAFSQAIGLKLNAQRFLKIFDDNPLEDAIEALRFIAFNDFLRKLIDQIDGQTAISQRGTMKDQELFKHLLPAVKFVYDTGLEIFRSEPSKKRLIETARQIEAIHETRLIAGRNSV